MEGNAMWKWEAEGQAKGVIVIVHNAYEDHNRYAWMIQQFRVSGFDVITGDLPGHSSEEKNKPHDESFESYIDFVNKMIQAGIKEGIPVFILAHGLGATITIKILQQQHLECAGVILSSPWLKLSHQPPKFPSMLTRVATSMKLDHGVTYDMLSKNEEERPKTRYTSNVRSLITGGWYKQLNSFMKSSTKLEQSIQDLPLLVHTAGEDRVTDTSETRKWLKRQNLMEFQYKEWRYLYHDVYQEPEREEVFTYTKAFIDNVLRSLGYIVEN